MLSGAETRALDAPSSLQLQALDGGTIEFSDLTMFSDSGELDGKPGRFAAPAFLIRHPKARRCETAVSAISSPRRPKR